MKYKYAVVEDYFTIKRYFDDRDEAYKYCYKLRRDKYANHNRLKEIEYDRLQHDNGLNVVKISEKIY